MSLLEALDAIDERPVVDRGRSRRRRVLREIPEGDETTAQVRQARVPFAWANGPGLGGRRAERGIGCQRSVAGQGFAQPAIERELRRHLDGSLGNPVRGQRRADKRREVVLVAAGRHPEPDRARIDAAGVQISQVQRRAGAEVDVESHDVRDGRRRRSGERGGSVVQVGCAVVLRVEGFARRSSEEPKRLARVRVGMM